MKFQEEFFVPRYQRMLCRRGIFTCGGPRFTGVELILLDSKGRNEGRSVQLVKTSLVNQNATRCRHQPKSYHCVSLSGGQAEQINGTHWGKRRRGRPRRRWEDNCLDREECQQRSSFKSRQRSTIYLSESQSWPALTSQCKATHPTLHSTSNYSKPTGHMKPLLYFQNIFEKGNFPKFLGHKFQSTFGWG